MILRKYKIFCETDSRFEFTDWRDESLPEPTTCPVDSTHTCNLDSVAVEDILDLGISQVNVVSAPEPAPFATPSYRTKWDASPDVTSLEASQTVVMDHTITEERYIHGGSIVYSGVQVGDSLSAQIVDDQGSIPEPYRATLCENWPVVATYIFKHYLPPGGGFRELNTYPLNAKITPGLILRVTVSTCSAPGTRQFATNYLLTKKLL